MNTKIAGFVILGLIAGFIGGFMLANGLNRSEINDLRTRAEPARQGNSNLGAPSDSFLISDDELRLKIEQADKNPNDTAFQKNLGPALYRYARMKNDPSLISESARILERAYSQDPGDYGILVDLGNAHFDIAASKKDGSGFERSRELYLAALKTKPNDAEVIADLALTYLIAEPKDTAKAIAEFEKAIKIDAKQQRALQFLTQAYIEKGDFDKAAATLENLKAVNPANGSISGLESQITSRQAIPLK